MAAELGEPILTRPQYIIDPRELPDPDKQQLALLHGKAANVLPEATFLIMRSLTTVDEIMTELNVFRSMRLTGEAGLREPAAEIAIGFLALTQKIFAAEIDRRIKFDTGTEAAIKAKAIPFIEGQNPGKPGGKVDIPEYRALRIQMFTRHNWLWSEQQRRLGLTGPQHAAEVILRHK